MDVVQTSDPGDFLEQAAPVLLADEARHNLIFGVAGTLRDHPGHYPEHRLWLVRDGHAVVGAAVRTPPHYLIVAGSSGGLEALAEAVDEDLPGVVGAVPEVEAFARSWEAAHHGVSRSVQRAQGIYALEQLIEPPPVPGTPRPASESDRQLLVEWLRAFGREALGEETSDDEQLERVLSSRLARSDAGFVIWEDGDPVSLAGFGGPTPNGIRIGPVYTPPEHRGRGFGSAVTAAVTAARLAAGRRFCFLYTDLANPVSNRIYMRMGYQRVCDSMEYAFVPKGQ